MKSLTVQSAIKEFAHSKEPKLQVSEEFYPAFEKLITATLEAACARATANGRTTLMAKDL